MSIEMKRRRPIREELVTQACLEAYGRVRHEGWLADRALEVTLRSRQQLFAAERRAAAERVYAVLRRQLAVDFLLSRTAPDFERWNPSRQDLLRFAVTRILEGESKKEVGANLPATERTLLERVPALEASLAELPAKERFALEASLPPFLAQKFLEAFGDEAHPLMRAMNKRAPLTARVNTLKFDRETLRAKLDEEKVGTRPCLLSPLGLVLDSRHNAFSLQVFKEGGFELQDEGSQLLGMLVDAPPTRVVDACAGAGGKTLQLAAQMKNRGELFALDIEEKRLDELRRRARRADVHNVRVRVIPPEGEPGRQAVEDLRGKADRVLVDAPCSGTGTFRRKPDARYRLGPEDLALHTRRQRELLARFSEMVKPGGRLIYGTCSILREENETQIETFLREHPEFSVRPVSEQLGAELGAKVERDGFLRLSPHLHGTDGFFGAILVRARG